MQFLDTHLQTKFPELIHSTYYKRGGHFAALEMPRVVKNDFIEFINENCVNKDDES